MLALRPETDGPQIFDFLAGQYLTLRATIDGQEVRRCYSICSPSGSRELEIGIKQVPGGLFSNWAAALRPGDRVESLPPTGSFHATAEPAARRHLLAVAGGSGITPVLGIARTILASEPGSSFTLLYGNLASSSIMFREALEDLKNQHIDRFQLVHVLERESQDIELFNGRLDGDKCRDLLKRWTRHDDLDCAFLCGPEPMMLGARDALEELGLEPRRIRFELFTTPGSAPRRRAEADAARGGDRCRAEITIDGHTRTLDIARGAESILDAGLREGVELPYACKGGVCSTCRARLLEGEVDMDANHALEDYEVSQGYILTCQSFPVTDTVVVDFDQ